MEKKPADQYCAEDVYPYWSKLVRSAKESIIVISPYVDNTVKSLLTSKHILYGVEKQIVTRVDSDTIFDKPYQIRALINCSKAGIKVSHLDALHAKLLIIDEKDISLGSQNFTRSGRENKETSVVPSIDFSGTKFIETIKSWLHQAKVIDLEYLLLLEKGLKGLQSQIKNLRKEHSQEFEGLASSYENSKINKLIVWLREIEKQSRIKFASELIYITKSEIENRQNSIFASIIHSSKETYLADSSSDLTKWRRDDDSEIPVLHRLSYYPMINVENSAIAFVRLGKTRISTYRTQYPNWGNFPINGKSYAIGIECPQEGTNAINIKFYLKRWFQIETCLSFFFDGKTFNFVHGSFHDEQEEIFIKNHFLNKKKVCSDFFSNCLRAWHLIDSKKPITNFLSKWRYKLYIIEYNLNPILIAE